MITAKRTHLDYARYTDGIRRWYRSVLEAGPGRIRVSRRRFRRAAEARQYRAAVLTRFHRMRGSHGRPTDHA